MARIGAVIFDLDGTLLDTEPLLDRANASVLRSYGRDLTPALRARLLGRTRADTNRIVAEAAGPSVDPHEVGAARAAMLDGRWSSAGLRPGAARLVARLAAAGTPMAIATSSTTAALEEKLRCHDAIRAAMRVIVLFNIRSRHRTSSSSLLPSWGSRLTRVWSSKMHLLA